MLTIDSYVTLICLSELKYKKAL